MGRYKIVHDTVHGGIRLDELFVELISTPEMMRLASIKQLGIAYLVFPGANHTRFEHSLGTGYVAGTMAEHADLEEHEAKMVATAALLHDIGHGPFSHVLESVLHAKTGKDHMDVTKGMIKGEYTPQNNSVAKWGTIPEILEKHGMDPKEVAALVQENSSPETNLKLWYNPETNRFQGEKKYLGQIIHGVVDADQIDYLLRDSHYTGVAHGGIDLARLMNTLEVFNQELVVNRKGISAVEGMLVARSLMYSSVYFHKTVRIGQNMMCRAFERMEPREELHHMVDAELLQAMTGEGGFPKEIVDRIRYRKLYKTFYARTQKDMSEREIDFFKELASPKARREMEEHLARRLSLQPGGVIIDMPLPELLLSEPRIDQTEIKVTDGKSIRPLSSYSTISTAVQKRTVPMFAVAVSVAPEALERAPAVVQAELAN
ncbi:MAG: HD domain-containing protein [Candidatus Thermoplasmatota archaeon]|nr:HD domain-containing protein [Candidatus Thermoplasmatota archaeon]